MYEFQEWKTLLSSEDDSKAHLLNLYQFSNAWLKLGVNILQSATHLHEMYDKVNSTPATFVHYIELLHFNAHCSTSNASQYLAVCYPPK